MTELFDIVRRYVHAEERGTGAEKCERIGSIDSTAA
jgi:hypothetical protein